MIVILGSRSKAVLYAFVRAAVIFFIGALSYGALEVMTRGFTHISMGLLGGLSFMFISYTSNLRRGGGITIFEQLIVSALFITVSELLCGFIVNLSWELSVWDYSDMPLNYLGQICLPFSILWMVIAFAAVLVEQKIRISLFHQNIPLISLRRRKTAAKEAPLPL